MKYHLESSFNEKRLYKPSELFASSTLLKVFQLLGIFNCKENSLCREASPTIHDMIDLRYRIVSEYLVKSNFKYDTKKLTHGILVQMIKNRNVIHNGLCYEPRDIGLYNDIQILIHQFSPDHLK